jgi:uncharacterized membrane protein
MNGLGRPLIIIGLLLVAIGLMVTFFPKLPTWLGRLPGDISVKRDNFSFHFPVVTCLVISAILSLIMWLLRR